MFAPIVLYLAAIGGWYYKKQLLVDDENFPFI